MYQRTLMDVLCPYGDDVPEPLDATSMYKLSVQLVRPFLANSHVLALIISTDTWHSQLPEAFRDSSRPQDAQRHGRRKR